MTTLQSIIDLCARRSLGHPGYGWIDAQPAVQLTQPSSDSRHSAEAAVTVRFMTDGIAGNGTAGVDGIKGAQEGLT